MYEEYVYLRLDDDETKPKYAIVAIKINVLMLNPKTNSQMHIMISYYPILQATDRSLMIIIFKQ